MTINRGSDQVIFARQFFQGAIANKNGLTFGALSVTITTISAVVFLELWRVNPNENVTESRSFFQMIMLPNGITPFFGNEKASSHPKNGGLPSGGVTGLYHQHGLPKKPSHFIWSLAVKSCKILDIKCKRCTVWITSRLQMKCVVDIGKNDNKQLMTRLP